VKPVPGALRCDAILYLEEVIMPKHGDKLYRCFDGTLETAMFEKEAIADGATQPTWLIRYHKPRFGSWGAQVSRDYYCLTEREAYEKYLREVENVLPQLEKGIQDAQASLDHARSEAKRVSKLLGLIA
jgi:hypothetical protein